MSKFSRTVVLMAIALIIVPQFAHAGWMRTYGGPKGEGGKWVEITDDGSYVICGATIADPYILGFILKVNPEGDSLWMPAYRVSRSGICHFSCIQQTQDKGYVLAGHGYADNYKRDLALLKTDSAGDSLWAYRYGGDGNDCGWFIQITADGGYIMTGWTNSYGAGEYDIWVVRTDSLGDTLWTLAHGGEEDDYGYCVRQTSDGNFVVVGKDGTVSGESAVWLLKIDDEGNLLWERKYGGNSEGRCVQETADGGLIISGSSHGGGYVYLLRTDSVGDTLWTQRYAGNPECRGYCVEQTTDRGYVIAGITDLMFFPTRCNGWLIKTDSLGDTLWTRKFILTPGGDNTLRSVHQTADGGYIIAGRTGSAEAEKAFEIWLIKTDSLGYVSITEDKPDVQPAQVEVTSTVDTHITLYYTDHPNGFHAVVYDASGQKVGEIHNPESSGTILWGQWQQAGVYFIRQLSGSPSVRKVVLVR
jgi:hypothetical protein